MKQRISLKVVLVSLLIFLTIFLPNSFDLSLLLTIGGMHFRFLNLVAFFMAIVLFLRSLRTRRFEDGSFRIRGFSGAVLLVICGIVASEAYLIAFENVNIRPLIQDTFPVVTPLLLGWALHLDGWRPRDLYWMTRLFLIFGVLVVVIDILLVLNYAPLYGLFGWKMQDSAFSARPNQAIGSAIAVAALLSLILPLALYMQKKGSGLLRIPYLVCPWFLLLGIALQASRLAAATVLLFLFLTTGTAKRGRTLRVAALASLFILIFVGYDFVGSYFQRYTVLRNASSLTRVQSGIIGLRIFGDHPIFGTGIGIFYPRAQATIAAASTVDVQHLGEKIMVYRDWATLPDPHDVYIMWLAEIGLVGFIGLVACIRAFAKYSRRVIRAAKRMGTDDTLFRAVGSGVLLVCAQMFGASFLLNNNRLAILIWVYGALTLEIGRRTIATAEARRLSMTSALQQRAQGERQYVA